MNRLHLFELEDQPWLPRVWRDGATDALNVLFATLAMYRAAAPVLVALMHKTGTRAWFDLCSGAGGGALAMRERLIAGGNDPSALTLSDRYPHAAAQQRVRSLNDATVRYHAESINAGRVSAILLPAIPLLFAWDGTVSALRAYTPEELLAVAASVPDGERYEWASAWAGQALYLTGHERAATVGMMSSEGGPS